MVIILYQHKFNEFVHGNNTKENEQILSQLIFDRNDEWW